MPPTQTAGATTAGATDDQEEETAEAASSSSSSGSSRPNRTRVTVDVERAIAVGIEAGLAAARQASDDQANSGQARAAAERAAVARVSGIGPLTGALATARAASSSPAVVTRPEFVYGPGSGRSFFGDGWRASRGDSEALDRLSRHYAMLEDVDRAIQRAVGLGGFARAGDVLSSEIAGAYPNDYLPGLITNRVLKMRPMGGFYQRFPIDDGRPRIYPLVSTSTTVAAQGAEGSNPAASDFATTATTITPTFYGGETKVSRQVLDGADPNTDAMLMTDLEEAYSQASEAVIRAAVEAGSTASGVALTAATPDIGLRGLVTNHLANVFLPAERLFLPTTLANSWATQNDTNGRPLAPAYNAQNASGVFDPTAFPTIGQVLYVPVVQSWSSTAGAGAGVGGVAVIGRSSDFAILESNLATFQYDQGAEAPSAVRIGLWAYLVTGVRRGSRKATGA